MKKIFAIMLSLVLVFTMASCGETKSIDQDFIESLGNGLNSRWDEIQHNPAESEKNYNSYVTAELDEIAEFKNANFENKELGKLAKKYILSLEEFKDLLSYYNTDKWYKSFQTIFQKRQAYVYFLYCLLA